MAMRILSVEDLDTIRAVSMSMLDAERSRQLMPNSTIQSYQFVGRSEFLVIRRVGVDWTAISAGTASSNYAGGDPISAQQLLRDAVIMFTCSFLCPSLKQIISKQEDSEIIKITRDLSWDGLQREYLQQAQIALSLLKPITNFVSGMTMSRPLAQPSDPDNPLNISTIRPLFNPILKRQN